MGSKLNVVKPNDRDPAEEDVTARLTELHGRGSTAMGAPRAGQTSTWMRRESPP
ncbi:hypothetical protein ACW0JT_02220 [Arthrobacter sp. SA17]